MNLDTIFLERCILTFEKGLMLFNQTKKTDIEHDLYRSACIKEFEIILEQSGKLLKKTLNPYFTGSSEVDQLEIILPMIMVSDLQKSL